MNVNTVADALLIGAAVVWVLARQVRVARVKSRLLWLAPLVLAYFGFRALPASTWHMAADLGLIALGAAVSVGLGVWRGQTIRVWREADGSWWRQGSVRTLALWGALIVARGLLYVLDAAAGHRDASGLGAILVTLAFSFAAQNAVIAVRMSAAQPLGGQTAELGAGRPLGSGQAAGFGVGRSPGDGQAAGFGAGRALGSGVAGEAGAGGNVAGEAGAGGGVAGASRLAGREGLHARRHERIQGRRLERRERRGARGRRLVPS
jgi:hypothetical protein